MEFIKIKDSVFQKDLITQIHRDGAFVKVLFDNSAYQVDFFDSDRSKIEFDNVRVSLCTALAGFVNTGNFIFRADTIQAILLDDNKITFRFVSQPEIPVSFETDSEARSEFNKLTDLLIQKD